MSQQRQTVFSGVQPTGKLHIGNFIGALSVWADNQDRYDNLFCVVDLHALTIPEAVDPEILKRKTRETAALYMACGIEPERSTIFVQSAVPAHAELAWILNCVTPVGWLERMTQYKTKASQQDSVGTGLLDYPVLQAADILLYQADLVPVGEDQRQHVELTRDIAGRFNHLFGQVFNHPEPMIRRSGARIMAFDEPTEKMSKSIGGAKPGHSVGLIDPPEQIRKTILRATTDSGNDIRFDTASPGVLNLLTLFEALSGQSRDKIEAEFDGKGYGYLKKTVSDLVITSLEPIQSRFATLMDDPASLESVLAAGADRASQRATLTIDRVMEMTGLG